MHSCYHFQLNHLLQHAAWLPRCRVTRQSPCCMRRWCVIRENASQQIDSYCPGTRTTCTCSLQSDCRLHHADKLAGCLNRGLALNRSRYNIVWLVDHLPAKMI